MVKELFKKHQLLILVVLFLLMIALRLYHPAMDPPHWLAPVDYAKFTDEGYKVYSARNMMLFGEWNPNAYDSYPGWIKQSPVSQYLYMGAFSILGVGYVQARVVNFILSVLSLIIFFQIVKTVHDSRTALLATSLLGFNFLFLVHSKLALLEIELTFFLLLSILFWLYSLKNVWYLGGSILCFMLALLVKVSSIHFIPALIFMVYITLSLKFKLDLKKSGIIIGGGILAGIALLFLIIPKVPLVIYNLVLVKMPALEIGELFVLLRRFFQVEFFVFNAVLMVCFLLYVLIMGLKWLHKKKIGNLQIAFLLAVLGLMAILAVQGYRPIRYFIPMTPALCYFTALFLQEWKFLPKIAKKKEGLFLYGGLAFILMAILINTYNPLGWVFSIENFKGVFFGAVLALGLIGGWYAKEVLKKKAVLKIPMGTIVLGLYILTMIIPIFLWFSAPQFSLVGASQDLSTILGEDDIILGINWPQAICVETGNECYQATRIRNEANEAFRSLGVTHFIGDGYAKPEYQHVEFLQNPRFEGSLTFIKTYDVGPYEVNLYEFDQDYFYGEE